MGKKKRRITEHNESKKIIPIILKVLFWVVVVGCLITSWWLRVGIQEDELKIGNKYIFPDVDAYYHLMQADYIYDHYPQVERFSDLLYFPEGQIVGQRPFMAFTVATLAKMCSLSVDTVGFYLPPIMFLLTLIVVLLIGWIAWNKWAGLIAMSSLSVIQGEIFGRTSVGFVDQHVMEIFLMALLVLFFILALKKHWGWAFGSGIVLGMQYMNWAGAPVFTLIILIFCLAYAILSRFKDKFFTEVTYASFTSLSIAFLIFAILRGNEQMYMLFYGCSVVVPIILELVYKYTAKLKAYWFPVILCVGGVAGLTLLYLVVPETLVKAYQELRGLLGWIGASQVSLGNTISEVQPILFPYGSFTFDVVWGNFLWVSIVGAIGLIVLLFTNGLKKEQIFILVWSLFILAITILQRRYAYYLAVNLCLLSGYLFWISVEKFGWYKKKGVRLFRPAVALVGIFLVAVTIVIPNFMVSSKVAHYHPYAMTTSWREALEYLKTQTPQKLDYGVISWWDYGYWIAREAKKPVPCHPGGGRTDIVAKFFVSQTTDEANTYAVKLRSDYVVIDYQMAKQKFYAIPILAEVKGFDDSKYNDSMLARLYYSKDGINGYRMVFASSEMYENEAQVKIYQRYDIANGCDCEKR